MEARKVIVSLNSRNFSDMMPMIRELSPYVAGFKFGQDFAPLGLFEAIRFLRSFDKEAIIFYDGKFADTPYAVGLATQTISNFGVNMLTVHASSSRKSVEAAVENKGNSLILGVTVLTSIDDRECIDIFGDDVLKKVSSFTRSLFEYGADGAVCSVREVPFLRGYRNAKSGKKFLIVTPGIRPSWADTYDQERCARPREAIEAGADYLVVGRPITQPPKSIGSPLNAIRLINEEIIG